MDQKLADKSVGLGQKLQGLGKINHNHTKQIDHQWSTQFKLSFQSIFKGFIRSVIILCNQTAQINLQII